MRKIHITFYFYLTKNKKRILLNPINQYVSSHSFWTFLHVKKNIFS